MEARRIFESNNRITFDAVPSDLDRQWWIERFFEPFGLAPEDVGALLSASWVHDRDMRVLLLDGATQRFSIRVGGATGEGGFWFHERTLDMEGSFMNADRMFVAETAAARGLGRRFMADAVALARLIGLSALRLDAEHIGRYVWLRAGFVPDRGSWSRLRVEMSHRLMAALPDLGPERFHKIAEMLRSTLPETARELAALRDPIASTHLFEQDGTPMRVPLGKALFLEIGSNWSGSFDVDDPASNRLLDAYVGAAA